MPLCRYVKVMVACLMMAVCLPVMAAQQQITKEKVQTLVNSLKFRQGKVTVPGAHASLQLTSGFSFLDAADARKVLEQLWHNPPDSAVLGMIIPGPGAHALVSDDGYVVVISYTNDGYVSDKNAANVDYDKLLGQMQEMIRKSNPLRKKQGYPALTLVGWAEPPHYDSSSHKLYWAKEVRRKDDHGETLNYDIRALGRHGYLSLNALASMPQLADVKTGMQKILPMVDFDQGSRYADFDSSTDHVAAYGISALIAGTLAVKAGLFAKLFAMLLAAKKLVLVGFAAVAAFLRKLFRRKKA